jgi:hypothetical protein
VPGWLDAPRGGYLRTNDEVVYPGLAYRCGGVAKAQPLILAAAIADVSACCVHAPVADVKGAG